MEIAFRIDPTVLDGRFANNGWLQELPKPITKLTWDNAVLGQPGDGGRARGFDRPAMQGGEHGQTVSEIVEIRYQGRTVRGALFPVAGHPDDCVTVHLGYGRRRGGHLVTGAGFNANASAPPTRRSSAAAWRSSRPASRHSLACTQSHHSMEGRGMVRAVTQEEFARQSARGARRLRGAAQDADAPPRVQVRRLQVGHGDRRQRLHRLQRVRRRLPGGEQHRRWSARSRCCAAARCTGCASTPTTAASRRIRRPTSSRCRAAVRERTVRGGLSRSTRRCTATRG